ncbi:DUF2142 domain-containing protein [Aeromicrobium sp. CTD01-1L150]|uniref:DUF2142 domain-containing protein n=1 Tax=Aeromicrobium sp. CTD01-1L150 TaxID=3341830 RepID=UPI0035BF2272
MTSGRGVTVAGERSFRHGVALLTLTTFCFLALWATLTPPLSTMDEPRHFNSVLRLVQGGGWPPPKTAPMLQGTALAATEARGDDTAERGQVPRDQRSSVLRLDGADPRAGKPDWMTQHPPTYYGLSAGLVIGTDAVTPGDQRWDQTLLVMRLFSCLLTAAAVPFVARSLMLVTTSVPASLVGTVTFLLIPQLFNSHSLVTNDSMVTLLGATLTWASLRAYLRPQTLMSSSVVAGLVLGVGLLTKGLMLAAVPVLAMFLLLAGRRAGPGWRHRFWTPLLGGAIALVVGGWWWLRNLLVHGQIQSSNYDSFRYAESFDGYSLGSFLLQTVVRLNRTFWASIRPALGYDGTLLVLIGATMLLVVVTALVLSSRRKVLLLTAVYPALVTALFTHHAWQVFWNTGLIAGVQGRYLYSGLTFLALALGLAWQELTARIGRTLGVVMAAALAIVSLVAMVGSHVYALRVHWSAGQDSLPQMYLAMVNASAVPVWAHLGLLVVTATAWTLAMTNVVRATRAASARVSAPAVGPRGS